MKREVLGVFAAMTMTSSISFAEVWPVTNFRCAADQLLGHPSEGATSEGRTGYGRTQWAYNRGYAYWAGGQDDIPHARRFWMPEMFNNEVINAATPPNDTDLYPVYRYSNFAIWKGPGPNNVGPGPADNPNPWRATTRSAITSLPVTGIWDLPGDVAVDALCEAGCYSPEQQIRVGDTFVAVSTAHQSGQGALTTLDPDATIDSIKFMENRIARWTVDIEPAQQVIVTLRMKSGGQMRVTTEHPLVTSKGVMKQAHNLTVGESLVQENGTSDPIVSIEKSNEFVKVYNMRPATTDLTSNILVAQGYLTGSARYQNEYVKYLNRALFRHNIPSAVIVRSPPHVPNAVVKQK